MLTKELLKIMNFKNVKLCLIFSILLASKDKDTVQQNLETFQNILAETEYNKIFFRSMKRITIKFQIIATRISFCLGKVDKEEQTLSDFTQELKEKILRNDEDGSKFDNSGIFFYNEPIKKNDNFLEKLDLGFYPEILFLCNGKLKLMVAELLDESSFSVSGNYKKENIKCHINGFIVPASCVLQNDSPVFIEIEDPFCEDLRMFHDINDAGINEEIKPYFAKEYMIYPNLVNFDSDFARIRFEILSKDEKEKINKIIENLNEILKDINSNSKILEKYDYFYNLFLRYRLEFIMINRFYIPFKEVCFQSNEVNENKKNILKYIPVIQMKEIISERKERLEKIQKRSEKLSQPKISSEVQNIYYKLTSYISNKEYEEDILQHMDEQFDIFKCLCEILFKAQETRIFECIDKENFAKLQNFAKEQQILENFYDIQKLLIMHYSSVANCNWKVGYSESEVLLQIQFFVDIHKSRMNSIFWKTNNLIFNEFIKVKKDKDLTEKTLQTIFSNLKDFLSIFSDYARNIIELNRFLRILTGYSTHKNEFVKHGTLRVNYFKEYCLDDSFQIHYKNYFGRIGPIDNLFCGNEDSSPLFASVQNERLSHVMKQFLFLLFNKNSRSSVKKETEDHKKDESISSNLETKTSFKGENQNTFNDIENEIAHIKNTFEKIDTFYEGKPISRVLKNDNETKSHLFTTNEEDEKVENDDEKELKAEFDIFRKENQTTLNNLRDKFKIEEEKFKTNLAKLETALNNLSDSLQKEEKMNADFKSAKNYDKAKLDFENMNLQREKKYYELKQEKETEIKKLINNFENIKKIYEMTKTTEENNMQIQFDKLKLDEEIIKLYDNIRNSLYQIVLKIDHILLKFVFSEDDFVKKMDEDITKNKFEFLNLSEGDHQSLLVIIKFVFETLLQIFDSKDNCSHINNSFKTLDINTYISDNQDLILKTCEELTNFMNLEAITLSDFQKWIKIWYKIDINDLNMHRYMQFALHYNFRNKVKTPESFLNH